MNFRKAVQKASEEGVRFRREGWVEGKLFVFHVDNSQIKKDEIYREEYEDAFADIDTEEITLSGHLDMVIETENGDYAVVVGWSPEKDDLLAEDYVIVD